MASGDTDVHACTSRTINKLLYNKTLQSRKSPYVLF